MKVAAKARKLRADGKGVEREVALDDWIDVGVFGEDRGGGRLSRPLFLERVHVTAPDVVISAVVAEKPARAGVDPYNVLIDRTPGDNVRAVSLLPRVQ